MLRRRRILRLIVLSLLLLHMMLFCKFTLVASFSSSTTISRRILLLSHRPTTSRLPSTNTATLLYIKTQSQLLRRDIHSTVLLAKPKRGAVVDSYRTVSVNCAKCRERLFRYKKKNGTKSNLIKCYIERIAEDSAGVLQKAQEDLKLDADFSSSSGGGELLLLPHDYSWECPNCKTQFARSAQIHGLPALKMVGGKVTMTKK